MPDSDHPGQGSDKVRSAALRREIELDGMSSLVVVVEVDLPSPKLEPVTPGGSGVNVGPSRFRFSSPEPDPDDVARRVAEARSGIEAITGGSSGRYLSSSGVFVMEASGEQVRRIAELPSVAAIWPNGAP